ncbi:PREDICTED: protein-methionine sulfoxide oxidase Mical isoform X2 [Nicrophorus vespilloides]|uniref:F-actin monooxygenase n=1 Tax=Nicrophorus vespilloides TaxID=110193 RepID=A0ABM1M3E7_NICVS|nr:PREDICTED: protein-methionine sulfoxide oxidase Mical isoform X2 [Nicrophorus vespilloides]
MAQRNNGSHQNAAEPRGRPVTAHEAALANQYFDLFLGATTLKTILGYYRYICDSVHLKPNCFPQFYPKLRSHLTSWRAKALWKKFDLRANHKCYGKGKMCPNTRVLIIGAGPCGLRTAIEAQLLGAKVVVIEKRDRMSRNNVLHLWPFVIDDLRLLGAKKFFGKFCAGAIDHISIRQLQCILLKAALLLGVEVHTEVSFERLIEPSLEDKTGWRAEFKPSDHPVSQYEFDVIIGADGKRNTLQGFTRNEFRGKLAIAITANFINKRTEAEARVEEISGVAFIFNQKFFKDLFEDTGIDLENIVYYKDDTHYFVMTAKKTSLIEKRVIKQDLADTARLLAPDNVDREALMNYAREAAEFSTNYKMLDLEFAVNHYGQPDVAMFDFTSMYAAENASRIIERHGYRLLTILVGDSLLEPFWPTGSGCARGFLSALDAGWAIRSYGSGMSTPLEVLAERESIYRLLAQTTPENLNKDYKSYTLDPVTRYPNLNRSLLMPQQTISFYDTDDPKSIDYRVKTLYTGTVLDVPKKRRRRDSHVDVDTLLPWIRDQIKEHEDLRVEDITSSFKDGRVLYALISHYRPDLLDYSSVNAEDPTYNNQVVFDILDKELGIPPVIQAEEMVASDGPDYVTMLSYLTQIYDVFRCEIPHIKHPKLELPESLKRVELPFNKNHPALKHIAAASAGVVNNQVPAPTQRPSSRHKRHVVDPSPIQTKTAAAASLDRKKKRKTMEKMSFANVEDRMRRLEEIAQNRCERQSKRRQQRKMQTDQFIKSMQMLQANCKPDHSEPFEDYSLFVYRQTAPNFEDRVKDLEKKFTYIPERSDRLPSQGKGEKDDDFQARIKGMEDKWRENAMAEKKPKDLLRAIGKIDNSDWNIKEIEKKIIQNKLGKIGNKDKEKVPKWSREQFLARQTKMEKQHIERQDSTGGKFAEIDKNIKILDLRLKEGSLRDLNQQHKVANITEKFVPKEPEAKPIQRQGNKTALIMPIQGNSETCHFCKKRVYFVERLSAEGKFFHRDCFKCQYCHTVLRLGSYQFDRDGRFGFRFYCSQHFGMPGELKPVTKVSRKPSQRHKESSRSPEKKMHGVAGVDLLDRVQTPERVSTLSTAKASSDHEESLSQMDEDEWTDRNFGPSTAEISDDDSSSISDTDSDDEEYEEALEEPPTKEGTLKWVERYSRKYMKKSDDSDNYSSDSNCSSYENSSGDDSDTATEGEEEIRARELRKQEVRVEPPVVHTDTGTDTEIASDDSSTDSSSEVQNSATEISTDSEFAQDDPTPTREVPAIVFNDMFVTKTRGKYIPPKKVQVTSTEIQKTVLSKPQSKDIELKFVPLVQTPIRKPTPQPHLLRSEGGYALNRTQSTGGIATKVSLELKKKYLLGDAPSINSIQKSGSASTLDSKFKSFHSTISDCQKLLKSASQPKEPVSPTPSNAVSKEVVPKAEEKKIDPVVSPVVNETEGRPRSPVHETSIIVPQIDWSLQKKQPASTSDSTSSSSSSSESEPNIKKSPSVKAFNNIPRVEIQNIDAKENITLDSLDINYIKLESQPSSINESTKAAKKTLNQPKVLPKMDNDLILNSVHSVHHDQPKVEDAGSGRSSPSMNEDQLTAVLTETELSDWAHDEMGSGELDYELNTDLEIASKPEIKKPKEHMKPSANKEESEVPSMKECVTSVLNPGLELNIEFMDTGTESSDDGLFEVKNNGYVQFHDEEDIAEDSLTPYMVNIAEATNPRIKATFDEDFDDVSSVSRNTGYCVIDSEKNSFGAEVIDLKATDLEKLKEKQHLQEPEEDSLLIVDAAGTTTEENTCSDSTVKNVTEIVPPKEIDVPRESEMNRKLRLEDKLAQVKKDMKKHYEQRKDDQLEFDRHCQRLQSKIDFGNAKDSIDIRKSRRQSKSGSPPKPDLIQEEKDAVPVRTFKQQIEYERDVNKKLVQEMVMNKMKAQNKSLERKRRNRSSFSPSPNRAFELTKSATAEIGKLATPDVLLSTMSPNVLQKSETVGAFSGFATSTPEPKPAPRSKFNQANIRPFSVHTPFLKEDNMITESSNNTEAFSLPDIHKAITDEFKTPKAPPRLKNEEAKRVVEKLKQDARARARLLSDEDLGLSPEEKLAKLRQRIRRGKENNDVDVHIQDSIESLVMNTERRNSLLYPNSTTKKSNIFRRSKSGEDHFNMCNSKGDRERTKSVSEITRQQLFSIKKVNEKDGGDKKCFKSDSNLLESTSQKAASVEGDKKKKDRERRKSITKIFTDLFAKKKDANSGSNKGSFLSRISPKSKDKSKSCIDLRQTESDVIKEGLVRTNSIAEMWRAPTPPPVPPLPANYPENKGFEDSSDCDTDWKCADRSSCDTLDQSKDCSMGSLNKRSGRSARKAARQSQLKRHRLAQEIQRKLEETEVKTRELESRGVKVEKALRGESADADRDETDLLKEWFELMRDRMELRRYERELNISAEEIELEDRHARLQHELKERLDKQGHKTQQDADIDGSIIKEMLDIVNKRDSLTKLLEDDRKRYNAEDRGLEEQMLAKGISLTPIAKVAEE